MAKKELTEKEKQQYIVLAVIGVGALAYVVWNFLISPNMLEVEKLEKQITALNQEIVDQNNLSTNKAKIIKDAERIKKILNKVNGEFTPTVGDELSWFAELANRINEKYKLSIEDFSPKIGAVEDYSSAKDKKKDVFEDYVSAIEVKAKPGTVAMIVADFERLLPTCHIKSISIKPMDKNKVLADIVISFPRLTKKYRQDMDKFINTELRK